MAHARIGMDSMDLAGDDFAFGDAGDDEPFISDVDDDMDAENVVQEDEYGDDFYPFRPGDRIFQRDAGEGCPNPDPWVSFSAEGAIDEIERDLRQDVAPEEVAALGGNDLSLPSVAASAIIVRILAEEAREIFEFDYDRTDIAASLKMKLMTHFENNIELFFDEKCTLLIRDSIPLCQCDKIYVIVSSFFEDESRQIMAIRIESARLKQQIQESGRSFQSTKTEIAMKKVYTSVCDFGEPIAMSKIQEDFADDFSFMIPKEMCARFFSSDDILGQKLSDLIKDRQKYVSSVFQMYLKNSDRLRHEIFNAMLKQIGFDSLFAFFDQIDDEHIIGYVLRGFLVNLRSESPPPRKGGFLFPWESQNYTNEQILRFSKVVSILCNKYVIKRNDDDKKIMRVLSTFKDLCSEETLENFKIKNEKLKQIQNNKYVPTQTLRRVLFFLFHHFISMLVLKLTVTKGDRQIISIPKGNAFLQVGKLHLNGGVSETTKERGMYIRVMSNGTFSVSDSIDELEDDPLGKDFYFQFVEWPCNVHGLVTQRLGCGLFIVALFLESDVSVGLWRYDHEKSKVSICSDDLISKGVSCMKCGRVVHGNTCPCTYLRTKASDNVRLNYMRLVSSLQGKRDEEVTGVDAFYTLCYDNGETRDIFFKKDQVIQVDIRILKRKVVKKAQSFVNVCIVDIVGPLLYVRPCTSARLRTNYHESESQIIMHENMTEIHYLNPLIKVILVGEGPLCTMSHWAQRNQNLHYRQLCGLWNSYSGAASARTFSKLCIATDLCCTKCKSGPIESKHACNFCGLDQFFFKVVPQKLTIPNDAEDDWVILHSCMSTFEGAYVLVIIDLLKEFDDAFVLSNQYCNMTYKVASQFHIALLKKIRIFEGNLAFYHAGREVLLQSDKFEENLKIAEKMREQHVYCSSLKESSFKDRLSSFVEDGSLLAEYRDREAKNSQYDRRDGRNFTEMRKMAAPISRSLQESYIGKELHDPFFPFQKSNTEGSFSKKVDLRFSLMGQWCTISLFFSHERRFSICSCSASGRDGRVGQRGQSYRVVMSCAGPYRGLERDIYLQAQEILSRMQAGFLTEEQGSNWFLEQIHDMFSADDTLNLQIYMLYVMCMRFFYASRGQEFYDIENKTWEQKYRDANFVDRIQIFHATHEGVFENIFFDAGARVKRRRIEKQSDEQFVVPDKREIQLRVQFAMDCVKNLEKIQIFKSRAEKLEMKPKYPSLLIDSNLFDEMWKKFAFMAKLSCRSKKEFLKLLSQFENRELHSIVSCGNCQQCSALEILMKSRKERAPLGCRKIKNLVSRARRQLEVFNEIVCFGICPCYEYFVDCKRCNSTFSPCNKDNKCVALDGVLCCEQRRMVSFKMSDGSNVDYVEERAHECEFLRMLWTWKWGFLPGTHEDFQRASSPKPVLFDHAACVDMDFFKEGSHVDHVSDT